MSDIAISKWGPNAWGFLHAISYTMPVLPTEEEKRDYETFFSALPGVLPCPVCRTHLRQHYKTHPPDCSSREKCKTWLINLHNTVNKSLGRPNFSRVAADRKYLGTGRPELSANGSSSSHPSPPTTTSESCSLSTTNWVLVFILPVIGIVLGYLLAKLLQKRRV